MINAYIYFGIAGSKIKDEGFVFMWEDVIKVR
jgi:hypothetical protein